jgi:hypothetical protein
MDSLAKSYWNDTQPIIEPIYPCSSFGWSLWVGQHKLLSTWNWPSLYHHANVTDILGHWSQCHKISFNLIHSIDWKAYEEATKCLDLNQAIWIPKWLTGYDPAGKVMQRYKYQTHVECSRFSKFKDTVHVVQFQAPHAVTKWEASIHNLNTWLLKAATMPDLRKAIISHL